MKLTIILSIKESHDRVAELLDQAGVKRFSTIDITGYKKDKESKLLNWFGEKSGHAKTIRLCSSVSPQKKNHHSL